jgi:aminoglycoside phosphotransferase (APT) family kinase protein
MSRSGLDEATQAATVQTAATTAIAHWLRGRMQADAVRITRYERLPGGAIQDNWMLDVDVDGGRWPGRRALVLRTDAPSSVAASLTRAQEFAVLKVAHAAGVVAPEPLFFCSDRRVMARDFFIMERLPGVAPGHRLTREATLVPDPDALAHALGANLARIHAIRPPCPDLDAPSPQASPARRRGSADHDTTELDRARGRGNGEAAGEGIPPPPADPALAAIADYRAYLDRLDDAYPALEWGLRWCERHAPSSFDVTLIHRDYRTGNYLVDAGRLMGVLDWEFAGWGDPREDLGWFTARCWRFGAVDREAGGIAPLEPFLRGYESVAGHRISRGDLEYWQVMAHLRWAVIALQQAQRHIAGGERSLELALTGRIVHELEYEVLQLIARGNA